MGEPTVLVTIVPDTESPSEQRTFEMPADREVKKHIEMTKVIDPLSFRKYWRVKDVRQIDPDAGRNEDPREHGQWCL